MSATFDVRRGSQARRGERKRRRFTSTKLSTGTSTKLSTGTSTKLSTGTSTRLSAGTSTRLSTSDKAQRKPFDKAQDKPFDKAQDKRRGAEPIEMRERRHGYFPKAFTWRGQRYDVHAVERCWTVSRRGWGGRVERHYFRVRCPEGTFEVYQDVRHNTWHLQQMA